MNDIRLSLVLLIFLIIGGFGLNIFDFIDNTYLYHITNNWCKIPIIIISIYWSYRVSFGYNMKEVIWKNFLYFILMFIVCGMMLIVAFQGSLLIINNQIGKNKRYDLRGKIVKLNYPKNKKILAHYSVFINRNVENDTIELIVPTNEYNVGDEFEQDMKVGSLGIIYK